MAVKPGTPDDVMSIGELKPILRLVHGEGGAEIGCSIALTEGREAIILVHKKEKPRQVRATLLKKAKDAGLAINTQTIRFGRATTSPDDEAVLLIKINKGPTEGPLPLAIKKRTKLAGFHDVIFTIDETLEGEGEEDTPDAAGAPVAADPGQPAGDPAAAPVHPGQPTAEQLRAIMAKLTPNIKAAMGVSIEQQKALMAASRSFVACLQASDLSGARHSLEDVMRLIKLAPGGAGPGAGDYKKAHEAWLQAIELVDTQLTALARNLKGADDPELEEIAEFGLNAVTNNLKVPLMAALLEVGAGTPDLVAKAGPKALAAAIAFRKHIETDERVEACDENPFDVPVAIRATLGPSLVALEAALTPHG